MNEPSASSRADASMLAPAWAVRLGTAVLIGFAIVAALTFRDASQRTKIEQANENTAVGDPSAFALPATVAKLPIIAAELDGHPLYLADRRSFEVRDTHVFRANHDVTRGLTLYQLAPTATDKERDRVGKMKNAYLLRLKPGEFVKVQTSTR